MVDRLGELGHICGLTTVAGLMNPNGGGTGICIEISNHNDRWWMRKSGGWVGGVQSIRIKLGRSLSQIGLPNYLPGGTRYQF